MPDSTPELDLWHFFRVQDIKSNSNSTLSVIQLQFGANWSQFGANWPHVDWAPFWYPLPVMESILLYTKHLGICIYEDAMTSSGTDYSPWIDSTSGANSSDGANSTFDPIPVIPIPPQCAIKTTPIPTPEKNGVITPLIETLTYIDVCLQWHNTLQIVYRVTAYRVGFFKNQII